LTLSSTFYLPPYSSVLLTFPEYFLSPILEPLPLAVFPDCRKPHSGRLSLHLDNCRVHRSKISENFFAQNYIIRVLHLLYIPDLASSDFWPLRHMNSHRQDSSSPGQRIFSLAFRNFWVKFRVLNWNPSLTTR
jgi:hypothetical protein